MPEWQITAAEYLDRVQMDISEFERELHLPDLRTVKKIIPLRDIHLLTSPPIPIGKKFLLRILRRLKTLDGQQPFPEANIQMVKLDPRHLKIGQKFAYRENYQSLLEGIPNLFHEYLATPGGLSDLGAYFVFGLNGRRSGAGLLPAAPRRSSRRRPGNHGRHSPRLHRDADKRNA